MERSTLLQIGGPNIVHEDFGDEMVVVHLDTGKYYSFNPGGAFVWSLLPGGVTVGEILDESLARFTAPRTEIENATRAFLQQLADETLVVPAPAPAGRSARPTPEPATSREEFAAPRFEVFDDMEDLLLLDPIHDVDETGWPNPPVERP